MPGNLCRLAIFSLFAAGCGVRGPAGAAEGPAAPVTVGALLTEACVPTGPERCFDARDDNCNGIIDEGCGVASGLVQFVIAWDAPGADVDLLDSMSAKVLGRVVASQDRPRGPDVQMSVGVPAEFIRDGATLQIELPRNLACAACEGGGCDACGRAGAVSLRGRADPAETVEVT